MDKLLSMSLSIRIIQNSIESGNEGLSTRIRGQGTLSNAGTHTLLIDNIEGNLGNMDSNDIGHIRALRKPIDLHLWIQAATKSVRQHLYHINPTIHAPKNCSIGPPIPLNTWNWGTRQIENGTYFPTLPTIRNR